ncbi:hypothetical protein Dsin_027488 [Dipteronia sinensis]|uniref:Endonuclease/exonuclease/phosphatase n=1 Tax=Dipteronia sinensis TaxID=43782 RepID=A0AAD9ZQ05_9ROSI|nr:hypothetical protein Dsin_027488 [Dipteronia sinensis]
MCGRFQRDFNRRWEAMGQERHRRVMEDFREALDGCGLDYIGFAGPRFTWCNKREGLGMKQDRLDMGVSCYDWKQLFPNSRIHHLEYWHSEHRPLLVEVLTATDTGSDDEEFRRQRFHFEVCWAEHSDCCDLIKRNWQVSEQGEVMAGMVVAIRNCVRHTYPNGILRICWV